ncbi:MAG: hypothetical protein ED557_02830 [Balneola sp.]|nr:MAG: hypothetical protein ED557_02830 [Balneola sp.]
MIGGIAFSLVACSGSRQTVNTDQPVDTPNEQQAGLISESQPTPQPDTLSTEEQLALDLKELYREELFEKHNSEANQLVNFYILAQQKLFTGEYPEALSLIQRAAQIKENADVLALRGSIYLGLGQPDEFVSNWRRALELDPEVPILPSPYVIQQLQLYGLIDENLQKNF